VPSSVILPHKIPKSEGMEGRNGRDGVKSMSCHMSKVSRSHLYSFQFKIKIKLIRVYYYDVTFLNSRLETMNRLLSFSWQNLNSCQLSPDSVDVRLGREKKITKGEREGGRKEVNWNKVVSFPFLCVSCWPCPLTQFLLNQKSINGIPLMEMK